MRSALVVVMLASAVVHADVTEPDPRADDAFDFMNLLARAGKHDLADEWWNVYGAFTWIQQAKLPFHAAYTNVGGGNASLLPGYENSFTGTLTIWSGIKLWPGAELYFVPEALSEQPLSNLHGLGGAIQNFEPQNGGQPAQRRSRAGAHLRRAFARRILRARRLQLDRPWSSKLRAADTVTVRARSSQADAR